MRGEEEYLRVLREVMETGEFRQTRNGMTRSKFSVKMDFDLKTSDGEKCECRRIVPLLTTKQVFWRGVVEELLWFLRADTDAHNLDKKGVKIWNGNSSREALDALGLTDYEEGDCGPIYGFQWRHFGAKYHGKGDYKNSPGGVDQLAGCLDLLRHDPTSRRIFMSAWNPTDLGKMCLPPCHVSYQFYVADYREEGGAGGTEEGGGVKRGDLCCMMYQRSADLFLGVPFNIASVALLTHILAKLSGFDVGSISLVIGDAHIYEEHFGAVEEQLKQIPVRDGFPELAIVDREQKTVDDFVAKDFTLSYAGSAAVSRPPVIRAQMKV